MEKNNNVVDTNISSISVYMGVILWVVVQDQPMLYKQEDVVDALSMRHGLIAKNN